MTETAPPPPKFPFIQLLPIGILFASLIPMLILHGRQLWGRSHYQFFPVVLAACAMLAISRWPAAGWRSDSKLRAALARAGYLVGLIAMAYATAKISPLLAWTAFVWLTAVVLVHGRLPLWGPWLLLVLLIRLPMGWDEDLIRWLQGATTRVSSAALDHLRIPHLTEGNIIRLPDELLLVEEACSGVVSLMTLVATCVVYAVWMRRSFLHGLLLAASGVVWAGAMNIIRVCVIVAGRAWYNVDLMTGTPHTLLGMAVFVIALGLMFSTDRLLRFLLGWIPNDPMSLLADRTEGNVLVAIWNFFNPPPKHEWEQADDLEHHETTVAVDAGVLWKAFDWSLAVLGLMLTAAQFYAGIGPFQMASQVPTAVSEWDEDFLPPAWGSWASRKFEVLDRGTGNDFGEHSRMWHYYVGPYQLTLSLDYPFQEWHELGACYRARGWRIERSAPERDLFRELEMTQASTERALLIFNLWDIHGQPYESPAGSFFHPTWRRVFQGGSRWTMPTYIQLQAYLLAPAGELSDEVRDQVREIFLQFQEQVTQQLQRGPRGANTRPDGGE